MHLGVCVHSKNSLIMSTWIGAYPAEFWHPTPSKGPRILEAEACTGNTEEGFSGKIDPELQLKGERAARVKS